jgi:hypothetical protein
MGTDILRGIASRLETTDFILTHKAETVKIESGITGLSEGVMSQTYNIVIGMLTEDCKFDFDGPNTRQKERLSC